MQLNRFLSVRDVANALSTWRASGSTNMADAFQVAHDVMFTAANGDRDGVPNFLLVITDGRSNNRTLTVAAAQRLRASGVTIVVVGVGSDVDLVELALIATSPSSSSVLLSTPHDGSNIGTDVTDAVVNILCQNDKACVSAPCQNGGTCIDGVGGTYTCVCTSRFTGIRCERSCSSLVDLIFVLDVSGSTRLERYLNRSVKQSKTAETIEQTVHGDVPRINYEYLLIYGQWRRDEYKSGGHTSRTGNFCFSALQRFCLYKHNYR